jgi:hypothetical protein
MRGRLLGGLGVAVSLWLGSARAEDVVWRPVACTPAAVSAPAATLGQPVAVSPEPRGTALPSRPEGSGEQTYGAPSGSTQVTPVAYTPKATLGPIFRAQVADPPPPGVAPVQPVPPIDDVLNPPPVADPAGVHHPAGGWLNGGWLGTYDGCNGRACLQSDHCFDGFISPVTSPFLFEDPRALTEIRPIFIWQQTPTKKTPYNGGDIEFFGIQARVAITERLSVTMTKLGAIWQEVHNPTGDFATHSGFAEMELGGKYTFLRNDCWGTVAAFGLTFEVPVGDKHVFQDTGSLSVRPYLSLAQSFGRSSYGTFNFMNTTGGSFALDNKRSDFIFTGLHLDFDVANLHKIYPLMELNYAYYTSNGHARTQDFEGRDLFNFGATSVSGHNNLTLAVGARYKFCESVQAGIATEWPIAGKKDLQDFRLTFDLIFRY